MAPTSGPDLGIAHRLLAGVCGRSLPRLCVVRGSLGKSDWMGDGGDGSEGDVCRVSWGSA